VPSTGRTRGSRRRCRVEDMARTALIVIDMINTAGRHALTEGSSRSASSWS
jgi:hypothetical protein